MSDGKKIVGEEELVQVQEKELAQLQEEDTFDDSKDTELVEVMMMSWRCRSRAVMTTLENLRRR